MLDLNIIFYEKIKYCLHRLVANQIIYYLTAIMICFLTQKHSMDIMSAVDASRGLFSLDTNKYSKLLTQLLNHLIA